MPAPDSPLRQSIGLAGVLRFLIAIGAIVAIVGALNVGRYALAGAGLVFLIAALALGYRAWRATNGKGQS